MEPQLLWKDTHHHVLLSDIIGMTRAADIFSGTAQQPGIIFMTMQDLFERIGELQGEKVTDISLSYLEIYNETIRDLLSPGGPKQGLMLREDSNQAVSVAGLSSHTPHDVSIIPLEEKNSSHVGLHRYKKSWTSSFEETKTGLSPQQKRTLHPLDHTQYFKSTSLKRIGMQICTSPIPWLR